MAIYPFHLAGLFPGGVSVAQNKVVVRDEAGQVLAWAAMPPDTQPGDLYRLGRLFEMFPEAEWYVGRPWQAVVELQLIRLDRQRQVDGAITFRVDGQPADGPYAWTAEICYSENGPIWEIDGPLPENHAQNDLGLRLALGEAIYRVIGGPPAAGRPGETTTGLVSNTFSREGLTQRPYRTRWLTSPLTDLSRLFAAEISRQA
jgi:hypothetical protein